MASPSAIEPPRVRGRLVRDALIRYSGGVAIAALAIGVRLAFTPLTDKINFTFYYFAVAASVWLFDAGPGLLTLAICYFAALLVLNPHGLDLSNPGDQAAVALAIAVNLGIIVIVSRLKTGQLRLRRAFEEMEALRENALLAKVEADRARETAERANQAKSEFLDVISHELRNPLNAILLSSAALRQPGQDDRIPRRLAGIDRAASAMAKMVGRLLDSTRIESGKLEIDKEPFDLVPVMRSAVEISRPVAEAKRISLSVDIRPASAIVNGDADRIQESVANLVGNAIKFTPEEGRVEVALGARDGRLELRIADSGAGIDPEFLPHVFERFAQDGSMPSADRGLGLGLFIVRHVVELHGGTIRASSEGKGRGSCFTMNLPESSSR